MELEKPVTETDNEYKNFRIFGKIKGCKSYPNSGQNFTKSVNKYWTGFRMKFPRKAEMLEKYHDNHEVRALYDDVMASVLKCDTPVNVPKNRRWKKAVKMSEEFFSILETEPVLDDWQISWNTSAGKYWSDKKARTKAMAWERFPKEIMKKMFETDKAPVCSVADKVELLSAEELARHKVRTIFPVVFHHLLKEKYLYDLQNKAILRDCANSWVKYGLVKQYGGFNRVVMEFEIFTLVNEGDCSGWDRNVFLEPAYKIRNFWLKCKNKDQELLRDFVTFFNCHTIIILPNGDVVMKRTGNSSGGNNTTADNCIAHFLIKIYICITILEKCNLEITLCNVFYYFKYAIYSDDFLGGARISELVGITVDEFNDIEDECYAEFGLTIKEGTRIISEKKSGERVPDCHSFLGSSTVWSEQYTQYVPMPRIPKICSSLIGGYGKKLDKAEEFARFLVLVEMLVFCEGLFEPACSFLEYYIEENKDILWLFKSVMSDFGVPDFTTQSFINLYTGYESEGVFTFFPFPKTFEREGAKIRRSQHENCGPEKAWIKMNP